MTWTPDQPIPSEARLAKEYGLSVGTVRKGVDGLVEEGLLERRQGSGTYVRAPSFDATLFRFFQYREADGSQVSIPSSQLILRSKTTAPSEAAAALGTDDVIKIVRLRSLADEPILYEEIYIPTDLFDGFETLGEETFGPLLRISIARDLDDAIHQANATRFGLASSIFSKDQSTIARFLAEARAGCVNVNTGTAGASSALPHLNTLGGTLPAHHQQPEGQCPNAFALPADCPSP